VTVDKAGAAPVRDRAKDKVVGVIGAVVITDTTVADKVVDRAADKDTADKDKLTNQSIDQNQPRCPLDI
jgi:hypothetical protein